MYSFKHERSRFIITIGVEIRQAEAEDKMCAEILLTRQASLTYNLELKLIFNFNTFIRLSSFEASVSKKGSRTVLLAKLVWRANPLIA